jgi:hypothetical protein
VNGSPAGAACQILIDVGDVAPAMFGGGTFGEHD